MAKRLKQLEFLDLSFKRAKQLSFEGFKKPDDSFGGSLLKSHPKTKRPLDSKYPILVTLRANRSGMRSFKKLHKVNGAVAATAKKYGIKIYDFANVGNHIHLVLKLSHNRFWTPFIRELTSKIAFLMKDRVSETKVSQTGRNSITDSAEDHLSQVPKDKTIQGLDSTGNPLKFWKNRPHTRIIRSWRQGFKNALEYIWLNRAEADGNINRTQTKTLKDYRALFAEGMISIKDPRLLMRAGFS